MRFLIFVLFILSLPGKAEHKTLFEYIYPAGVILSSSLGMVPMIILQNNLISKNNTTNSLIYEVKQQANISFVTSGISFIAYLAFVFSVTPSQKLRLLSIALILASNTASTIFSISASLTLWSNWNLIKDLFPSKDSVLATSILNVVINAIPHLVALLSGAKALLDGADLQPPPAGFQPLLSV